MNRLYRYAATLSLTALLLSGCAATYSPPTERGFSNGCRNGEVLVCDNHYPSRVDSENNPDAFCMCESLGQYR